MKFFSYTDSRYAVPPESISGEEWPVQFSKGYSEFIHQYHHKHVVFACDEQLNAWAPLQTEANILLRQACLLHAPVSACTELDAADQLQFFEKMIRHLQNGKMVHRLIQPHPAGMVKAAPPHSKWIPFGTYITDLSLYPDDDALLGTFDPKYKKAVQHSMKNGARVVFGKDCYDDFYKLYTHTTTRAGIFRDPPAFFEAQRRLLGDRHTETGVVYDGETAIGGIFMLYSRYAALCTHAGSGGESKLYGGMKYLHFEMMKRLRDAGVRYYDLVGVRIGSKNEALEGVFRFKKGFGGQLKEGFLWKADIAPLNVKLYNFIQKVRNKKISGDIIDQESLNEEKA